MFRTTPFRRALFATWIALATGSAAFADSGLQIIPLAQYQLLALESQTVHSPGIGVLAAGENLFLVGQYSRHSFAKHLELNYPKTYHAIELMADARRNRHQYLAFFKSESDYPVAGGVRTFQTVAVYGYEVVRRERLALILGGGLAFSDFGIETAAGDPWPLIPVPLVRAAWESRLLNANLDFITSPNLNLTLAPHNRLRVSLETRFDRLRDERDIIFEGALVYRLLDPTHPMGDIAGVSLGIRSDSLTFDRSGEDQSLELHSYALFSALDLTLLTVSGGYLFDSRLRYGDGATAAAGDGWFFSVSALIPLGGPGHER